MERTSSGVEPIVNHPRLEPYSERAVAKWVINCAPLAFQTEAVVARMSLFRRNIRCWFVVVGRQ